MTLSADEVLEDVGSFGWFQKRLLILFNLLSSLLFGWAVMVTGIITAEPPWKCVKNSSVCLFDEPMAPGDDNYDYRCNISRNEWVFDDEMTSVVTEVRIEMFRPYTCNNHNLCGSISSRYYRNKGKETPWSNGK